jgi:hypothetical protein
MTCDRQRHGLRADREMHERALRLRVAIMLRGHFDRPEIAGSIRVSLTLIHANSAVARNGI